MTKKTENIQSVPIEDVIVSDRIKHDIKLIAKTVAVTAVVAVVCYVGGRYLHQRGIEIDRVAEEAKNQLRAMIPNE